MTSEPRRPVRVGRTSEPAGETGAGQVQMRPWRAWRVGTVAGSHSVHGRRNSEAYRHYRKTMEILAAQRRRATLPFRTMLMIAFSVHLLSLGLWSALTHRLSDDMPVNVVEIRLGDLNEDLYGDGVSTDEAGATKEKDAPAATPREAATRTPAPVRTKPVTKARPATAEPSPAAEALEEGLSEDSDGAAKAAPRKDRDASLAASDKKRGLARGHAEGGGRTGKGENYGNSDTDKATIAARYEQKLSAWLEGFRVFPKEGAGGRKRVLVRVRIDRLGHVQAKWIEESSGIATLDAAVLDQVRRASPFPPTPLDYPGGSQLEFRFPITLGKP